MLLDRLFRMPLFDADGAAGGGAGAGAGGADKGAGAGGADKGGAGAGGADKGAGGGAGAGAGGADKGAGGGGAEPFYKTFALEQGDVDYIEGKGVKDFAGLLKVTRDFEGVARSRNVMEKPDPKKPGEWKGWTELGWVEKPEDYKFKAPEKGKIPFEYDGEFMDELRQSAHKNRVPLPAAQALHDDILASLAKRQEAIATRGAQALKDTETALRQKWPGGEYDRMSELAKRAARTFAAGSGIDNFKALEDAVGGAPGLLAMFAAIGEKVGEASLIEGDIAGGMTPASARAERLKLEGDDAWMKIFKDERHPQYSAYQARRSQLLKIEARGQKAA